MEFCSPFDEALARTGPAAVFLPDRDGLLRFEPDRTRDCWERTPGPHEAGWTWLLLRDRGTGFVNLLLVTSPTLIPSHPRADVRRYEDVGAAQAALSAFGRPALAVEAW